MTVNLFKLFFFLLISFLLLTPIALVITNGLSAIFLTNELYINRYLIGSTKLIVMVSIFTTIISVPLAWINTMTELKISTNICNTALSSSSLYFSIYLCRNFGARWFYKSQIFVL